MGINTFGREEPLCAGRGSPHGQTRRLPEEVRNLADPDGGVSAYSQPEGSQRPRVGRGCEGRLRRWELREDSPSLSVGDLGESREGQSNSRQHPGQGAGQRQARVPSPSAPRPDPQPPWASGTPPPAPTSPGVLPPRMPCVYTIAQLNPRQLRFFKSRVEISQISGYKGHSDPCPSFQVS